MTINPYDKGNVVRVSGPFDNTADGTDLDPGTVLFTYRNPADASVTLQYGVDAALVKDSVGDYHVDIDADVAGMWHWRWHSTGSGKAASSGQFYVRPSMA